MLNKLFTKGIENMDFVNFKVKFMEDIKERLEDAGIDANITTNTVKKLNESYEAVTITPNDSNMGMNLPIEKFFEAYDDGRPYDGMVRMFSAAKVFVVEITFLTETDISTFHPLLADYDSRNEFDVRKYVENYGKAKLKPDTPVAVFEV